jgi:hypothetical protein
MIALNQPPKSHNELCSKNILIIFLLLSTSLFADTVKIQHKDRDNIWQDKSNLYVKEGQSVKLRANLDNYQSIKWYQIIPDTSQYYKNANFPWEKNPYQWNGFGKINYEIIELSSLQNKLEIDITPKLLSKNRPKNNPYYSSNLGSFWFVVEAVLENGKLVKSPGLELNNAKGLSPTVFRVSYIESHDYIGYLTSFFNVPGIFGSIPYQSINYIGADCADVLMAAKSVFKQSKLKDFNVAMLVESLESLASINIKKGIPNKTLKWDKDLKPGDFIAVRYRNQKQFAHIGALYKDSNKNGVLDSMDLILHAGPDALHVSALAERGFDGEVRILKNN